MLARPALPVSTVCARGATISSTSSLEEASRLVRGGGRFDAVLVATAGIQVTVPALDALAAQVPRLVLVVPEGEASPAERALLEADAFPFAFEPIEPDQLEAQIAVGRPSFDLRPSLSA